MDPKHKPAERTATHEPTTKNLLTDESEILKATLKSNIGVLTKNKVRPQDLDNASKQAGPSRLHNSIMTSDEKRFTEALKGKTYRDISA